MNAGLNTVVISVATIIFSSVLAVTLYPTCDTVQAHRSKSPQRTTAQSPVPCDLDR